MTIISSYVYTVIITHSTDDTDGGKMKVVISNISGVPIYEQIKEQIKSAILSGELEENERLPSLRSMAKDLKISVLTTTRAYTDLEQEGYVVNIQGKGCFVMSRGSEMIKEQLLREVETNLIAAIKASQKANLTKQELSHMLNMLLEVNENE